MTLQDMRRHYQRGVLREEDVFADPIAQFDAWFREALAADAPDWFEPNAMTLATASAEGTPSARVVLLKDYDEAGFTFYTNYASHKGRDLAANPSAEMCFFWPPLERQIRISGRVTPLSRMEAENYFHSRPRGSQLGACVSQQSSVVPDRATLEQRLAELAEQYEGQDIPMPETWGGYRLVPETIEFWQGQPSRLHDRLRFTRQGDTWKLERLSP